MSFMPFNSLQSQILEKWFFSCMDAGMPMTETPLASRNADPAFIQEVALEMNLDTFTAKQCVREAVLNCVPA